MPDPLNAAAAERVEQTLALLDELGLHSGSDAGGPAPAMRGRASPP